MYGATFLPLLLTIALVDFVLGTPELAALRGRMMKIAAEVGLTDVHNDSVHLLMNAVEVR